MLTTSSCSWLMVAPPVEFDEYYILGAVKNINKADIYSSNLEKFLQKAADELSKIIANDKVIRQQEKQHDQKIETLKQEYLHAETAEI